MCRAFSPVLAGLFVVFGSAYSQIAPRSVSLSWTASASPNVRRYKIYRGTASGGPYRLLTSPPVVGTSYIYRYRGPVRRNLLLCSVGLRRWQRRERILE